MTVRGHIENGVIVPDEPLKLPEGAVVEIRSTHQLRSDLALVPGTIAAILHMFRETQGPVFEPGELKHLEQVVEEGRDHDVKTSIERGEWEPPRE